MTYPLPIDETIGTCVANVATKMLTDLMADHPAINTIRFMYGPPMELANIIKKLGESSKRNEIYPAIMLFSDVDTSNSSVRGLPYDVTLNMAIVMPNHKADMEATERISTNFVPILRPIYKEFINQIFRSGYFHLQSPNQITGHGIERIGGAVLNGPNAFNTYIDAIEIRGMKLTPTLKGSVYVGTTQKVWRTVVLYIKASPDNTQLIQVGGGRFIQKEYAAGNTLQPKKIGDANGYLAGKTIELPWFYSDTPRSVISYDDETGTWDRTANNGFTAGSYITIKFLDNA